jgi:NAD(P)-dependent dehydrogenase (short-subunit alcohol dehydrogenase family)
MADSKVTLVTGASSGIGRAIASLLAGRGHRVFGTSRNPAQRSGPEGVEMLELDVRSDESVARCVAEVMKRAGRLDVLVNNAGFGYTGAVEETTIEDAKGQFETNFFGTVRMVKAALPVMRGQGGGWIINITSLADRIAAPLAAFYSASKAAARNYSQSLRYEVRNFGIRVSVVEPGFIRTDFFEAKKTGAEMKEYASMRRRLLEKNRKAIERGADPMVVARRVLKIIDSNSPPFMHIVPFSARLLACMVTILRLRLVEFLVRKALGLDKQPEKA